MNKLFATLATIAAFSTPAYSGTDTEDLNMIFEVSTGQPMQVAELSRQEMTDTKGAYFGYNSLQQQTQSDMLQAQMIQAQFRADLLKYLGR